MADRVASRARDGLRTILSSARSAPLWVIPTIYMIAALAAGMSFPRLERVYFKDAALEVPADVAVSFFSAVASGVIAFMGVVFAVAFVIGQVAASAYSPRLAADLVTRPGIYHTLGLFFATLTYSLAALVWTGRGGMATAPPLSTYVVVALLVVSLLAFARMIHGVAALKLDSILGMVGKQGRLIIESESPATSGGDGLVVESGLASSGPADQTLYHSGEPCVVAWIDAPRLAELAGGAGAVVTLESGLGDAVLENSVLLRVRGAQLPERELRAAIRLARHRTFDRDPKYPIRILVDMAIRALSPAVNDPTTAVQALDQIEDLLRRLGRRPLDLGRWADAAGQVRVIYPAPTWDDYLALAFDEIRQFGATSVQVDRRLGAALIGLADTLEDGQRRTAVLGYLAHLDAEIGRSAFDASDREAALQPDRQGLGLTRRPAANALDATLRSEDRD